MLTSKLITSVCGNSIGLGAKMLAAIRAAGATSLSADASTNGKVAMAKFVLTGNVAKAEAAIKQVEQASPTAQAANSHRVAHPRIALIGRPNPTIFAGRVSDTIVESIMFFTSNQPDLATFGVGVDAYRFDRIPVGIVPDGEGGAQARMGQQFHIELPCSAASVDLIAFLDDFLTGCGYVSRAVLLGVTHHDQLPPDAAEMVLRRRSRSDLVARLIDEPSIKIRRAG